MKRVFASLWMLFLFVCAGPLYAQGGLAPFVERAVGQQILEQGSIAALSQESNRTFLTRLSSFFQPPQIPPQLPYAQLPPAAKPITFRVQETPSSQNTATAFAVEIDGRLFGVTAGHVMANISRNPYMYFQTDEGKFAAEPITSWRFSNTNGTDVAVFEIPAVARDYVQVLPLATQHAHIRQAAAITGFALNTPLWLPSEEILFTNSRRLFLRNSFPQYVDGLCGSPVLVDGKVAGLYVGGYPHGVPSVMGWPRLLAPLFNEKLPPLHVAAPIENIFPLADVLLGKAAQPAGTMMKVLGMPVANLPLEDEISSVSVVRNGNIQQSIHANDLTDPEHLEQLLDLEENDIVRITIFLHELSPAGRSIMHYEINISTGEVTTAL